MTDNNFYDDDQAMVDDDTSIEEEQESAIEDTTINFNDLGFDLEGDYEPIIMAEGSYTIIFEQIEPDKKHNNNLIRTNKSGHPYVMAIFKFEDDMDGLVLPINHYVPLPIPREIEATKKQRQMANRAFQAFVKATGISDTTSIDLYNIEPFTIDAAVGIRENEQYGDSNVIQAFSYPK